MRRTDREIKDEEKIAEILGGSKIIRVGFSGMGGYPYVIPLHYGWEMKDGNPVFYMHGAKCGLKYSMIAADPKVCFELDCDVSLVSGGDVPCRYGSAYASIVGYGTISVVSDEEEKAKGLSLLMKTQTDRDFPIDGRMSAAVGVLKIVSGTFTAKGRLAPATAAENRKNMPDLIGGIKNRRSVRKFTGEKVPRETIEKIVDAARFAPSWKNTQTARYVVAENRGLLDRIAAEVTLGFSHNAEIIRNAPALAVVTSLVKRSGYERDGVFSTDKGDGWQMFDAGIAAETFMLAAHAYGIGSLVLGIFDGTKTAEIIGLEKDRTVSALIPFGFPAERPPAPPRKDISEYLSWL